MQRIGGAARAEARLGPQSGVGGDPAVGIWQQDGHYEQTYKPGSRFEGCSAARTGGWRRCLDEGGEAAGDIHAAIPYRAEGNVSHTVMTGWEPLRKMRAVSSIWWGSSWKLEPLAPPPQDSSTQPVLLLIAHHGHHHQKPNHAADCPLS
jgi:hypothetical protein